MKKLPLILLLLLLTACDSPTDCTPKTAAKFLLYERGGVEAMNNKELVNYVIDNEIEKSGDYMYGYNKYGKHISKYKTPICEVLRKRMHYSDTVCYTYIRSMKIYENIRCPRPDIDNYLPMSPISE